MNCMIRRIIAYIIDESIATFIAKFIIGFLRLENVFLYLIILLILLLFKDIIFGNTSIGKEIVSLEILDKNGEKPKRIKLILRNLTTIFAPIEFIYLLRENERISDKWLDLKVVKYKLPSK